MKKIALRGGVHIIDYFPNSSRADDALTPATSTPHNYWIPWKEAESLGNFVLE